MNETLRRFISAFNEIEKHLKKVCGSHDYMPFYQLVTKASENVRPVKACAADLREFGDLRNAIMHGYQDDRPLATPLPETVTELERIRDLLLGPPLLGKTFKRTVFICTQADKLSNIVKVMLDKDYSQVPVYDTGKYIGLLNTETITRWLSSSFDQTGGMLEDEKIGEVLPHAVKGKQHEFLAESHNAFDALDAFDKSVGAGRTLDAILVTANGKSKESPTGILTIFDVPKLRSLVTGK